MTRCSKSKRTRRVARLGIEKLVAFLGEEPHTPLDAALRETLAGLGCLAPRQRALAEKHVEGGSRLGGPDSFVV